MITRARAVCGALALALLTPVAAAAQPPNPFADLFGRAPARSGQEFTAVQFRTTAGAQVGQTIRADFDQADAVPEGAAGGADASLLGQYLRDRVQAIGNGRYSYQEFRTPPAFGAPAFDVGGRVNYEVTTRLSVQGGGQYVRSPFFQAMWLAPEFEGPPASPVNSAILLMANDTFELNAGAISQYSQRSSLSLSGFARETRFTALANQRDQIRGGRAMWKRQMSRAFALHAGYGRDQLQQSRGGVDERYVNELIDLGVDFAKSLTMARRTTLGFVTETSVVREGGGPRHYRLNGTVAFEHHFLRTWVTQLAAKRATEFLPGFRGPVFTERGRAALAGYFSKRVLMNVNAEGGQGAVGVNDQRQFMSYTGNAKITYGITRHIGVFTQYVYYNYQMPPDPFALVTVPHLSRQAVSVGVQTWVSLIDKKKVPRDPR